MYSKNKVLLNKSMGFIVGFQLLLCSVVLGSEEKIATENTSWIDQLRAEPIDLPAQVKTLDRLLELSVSRNSDIRARYADWRSSEEAGKTISSLPDPTIGLGYYVEPVETAQGAQSAKISLGQSIPWFSKTRAVRAATEYQSIQNLRALETERLELRRHVTTLWVEAGYLQSKNTLIEAKMDLLRDLEEVLNVQYQSASISHKQLVDLQIQTLQLENDLQDVASQFYRLHVRLGSLLEIEGPVPDGFLPSHSSSSPGEFSGEVAGSDHPRLAHMDAVVQEAQARKAGAQASFYPDLKIGVDLLLTNKKMVAGEAVAGSGRDPLLVSAGISLPLFNWKSKQAAVKSSQWREKQALALRDAENARLKQEKRIANSKLLEHVRMIKLYEDQLIPKAREIETVKQQEYISQSSDLLSYTLSRQQVLDLQLNLIQAQYAAQLQLADLRYLEGN